MIQTIESREVAKMLNMRHDNLIQKIRNITTQMSQSAELKSKVGDFYIQSEYFDDNNQLRVCYLLTKLGCEHLLGTGNGAQATNFKAQYILRFDSKNELSVTGQSTKIQLQALLEHEEKLEQIETDISNLKQEIDLTRKQKSKLSKLVRSNAMKAVGGKKSQAYESLYRVAIAEHWRTIKNYFEVSSYEEIPKLRFDEALELAECWQPSAELAMEIKRANQILMLA